MVSLRKKMIAVVGLLVMQGICGMDQQVQSAQQGVLGQYISPEALGSISNVAATGWGLVTTGFTKVTTTAINAYSDEAAFAKLGFPPTNGVNSAELLKFKAVSERHMEAILANPYPSDEQFGLDDQFLCRRFEFLKRAVSAVPTHAKGVELAVFCLENYEKVMNSFMISRLLTFVQNQKELSAQVAQDLDQKLIDLVVSTDSALLRSVLENSGIKRNSIEQDQYKEEKLAEEQEENKEEKNQDQQ